MQLFKILENIAEALKESYRAYEKVLFPSSSAKETKEKLNERMKQAESIFQKVQEFIRRVEETNAKTNARIMNGDRSFDKMWQSIDQKDFQNAKLFREEAIKHYTFVIESIQYGIEHSFYTGTALKEANVIKMKAHTNLCQMYLTRGKSSLKSAQHHCDIASKILVDLLSKIEGPLPYDPQLVYADLALTQIRLLKLQGNHSSAINQAKTLFKALEKARKEGTISDVVYSFNKNTVCLDIIQSSEQLKDSEIKESGVKNYVKECSKYINSYREQVETNKILQNLEKLNGAPTRWGHHSMFTRPNITTNVTITNTTTMRALKA